MNFMKDWQKVCRNKKFGFIDKLGHEIIPVKYDAARDAWLKGCYRNNWENLGCD